MLISLPCAVYIAVLADHTWAGSAPAARRMKKPPGAKYANVVMKRVSLPVQIVLI